MKHVEITGTLLHDNMFFDMYACIHMKYIKGCLREFIKHKLETKCKTIVKQRCADSRDQEVDMYNIWKFAQVALT